MAPLIVLISVFFITLLVTRRSRGGYKFAFSGRVAMVVMLLFTSIGHFAFTKGMSMMLPQFIPYKTAVVYLTGFIEIAAAIGLLIRRLRVITGWLLIAFFIFILPANILAALHNVDYQAGTFQGPGSTYLWFRIPIQIFFIVWTYLSAIKWQDG